MSAYQRLAGETKIGTNNENEILYYHLAVLTKYALIYGTEETIKTYMKIKNAKDKDENKIFFYHWDVFTGIALKYGIEKALEINRHVEISGRGTANIAIPPFSELDEVPLEDVGLISKLSVEFGFERAIPIYDKLVITGTGNRKNS